MERFRLKQVELPPAREQVASILRDAILSNELKRGDTLNISALASELGVSALPVREALSRLERDGLVRLTPHKPATVLGADAKYIREYYGIRSLLEGEAALLASRKGADISPVYIAMAEATVAFESSDTNSFSKLNRRVHEEIWAASDNHRLKQLLGDLWMSKAILQPGYTERDMEQSHLQHQKIVQSIAEHRGELARKQMQEHLRFGMEVVLRNYDT